MRCNENRTITCGFKCQFIIRCTMFSQGMTHVRGVGVGGADKPLAQPGRKQTTATKLGIYSTYSPRSSIHFLASCSNFCKSLKKKNQKFVRPTRSPRQQWPPRRTKNGDLAIFLQSREQLVVRRGQIRRIGWVIKSLEAQVGQVLGCKCPVNRGIVVQEQDPFGNLPAAFFLQNALQLHHQRWVILRVVSLTLLKIINEEDAVLIPKNRGENFSSGFLHSEFLGVG